MKGKMLWPIGAVLVVVAIDWIERDPKPAPPLEFSDQQFSEHSALASRFLARFDAEDFDEAASYMAPAIRSPSALETQRKPLGRPARVSGERTWGSMSYTAGSPPEFHYRVEYANAVVYLHVGVDRTEQGLQVVSFHVE